MRSSCCGLVAKKRVWWRLPQTMRSILGFQRGSMLFTAATIALYS